MTFHEVVVTLRPDLWICDWLYLLLGVGSSVLAPINCSRSNAMAMGTVLHINTVKYAINALVLCLRECLHILTLWNFIFVAKPPAGYVIDVARISWWPHQGSIAWPWSVFICPIHADAKIWGHHRQAIMPSCSLGGGAMQGSCDGNSMAPWASRTVSYWSNLIPSECVDWYL